MRLGTKKERKEQSEIEETSQISEKKGRIE